MSPNTGQIIPMEDLRLLRETDTVAAAEYTVEISGPPEEVRRVSQAVKEANRRRNKAARKARKASR